MFALVDGNNFFVSCERAFDPRLWGIPVVVLSNNDGCIIARSPEAKRMGIPMGAPFHDWKQPLHAAKGRWLSANFVLYGDLSARMGVIMRQHCDDVESYSIDESFCWLPAWADDDLRDWGLRLRFDIYQQLGLPVCVGLAPTKTLAKLANHIAKKFPEWRGVCSLQQAATRQAWLAKIDVGEVWGVGSRLQQRLKTYGITTVADLAMADRRAMRQLGSVTLERTQQELQGQAAWRLNHQPEAHRHHIIASRSFGKPVRRCEDLCQAVSSFSGRAAEKLRQEAQLTNLLEVTLSTNRFADPKQWWRQSTLVHSPHPTNDSRDLARLAIEGVKRLYRPDLAFHKAGIMLMNLQPTSAWAAQGDLFSQRTGEPLNAATHQRSQQLMQAMDSLNRRYGARVIHTASNGLNQTWLTRRNHVSPAYTSRWDELLTVD